MYMYVSIAKKPKGINTKIMKSQAQHEVGGTQSVFI